MLTEQRKRFVHEYLKLRCKNKRQAAINAGYSPKSASQQACDLLKDPEVLAYLQKQKSTLVRRIQEELVFSASDAVSTVYGIMTDKDAKDADRLKAAFDILDRAGFRPDDRNNTEDTEAELPKLLEALQKQEEA